MGEVIKLYGKLGQTSRQYAKEADFLERSLTPKFANLLRLTGELGLYYSKISGLLEKAGDSSRDNLVKAASYRRAKVWGSMSPGSDKNKSAMRRLDLKAKHAIRDCRTDYGLKGNLRE